MAKKANVEYVILAVLLLVFAGLLFVYFTSRNKEVSKEDTSPVPVALTPTISPRPIPHGKIGFTVAQSDKTVPQFGRGFIDPYDPEKGATQSVTINANFKTPIEKVTAVLKTDKAVSKPVSFKLIDGTTTNGTWLGTWPVTDTYLYTYALVLNATSTNSSASVEVTLR